MILAFYRLFTRVHCIGISKRCHNVTCFDNSICGTYGSGMDAPPRGEGGFPAPPRTVGRGGFPAPSFVKMIKAAGKLRGKINTRISTFSKRGNKWWNNITTLNNDQSSLSIGYARESKKWKYLFSFFANRASNFVLENLSTYEIAPPCPKYHS